MFRSSVTKTPKVWLNVHGGWCSCGFEAEQSCDTDHGSMTLLVINPSVYVMEAEGTVDALWTMGQRQREKEKEGGRDKTGGERENGRESRWVFLVWTPSPSSPFSPRWTTPMSNGINHILGALTQRPLLSFLVTFLNSFFKNFYIHRGATKYSRDQTGTDLILPTDFYLFGKFRQVWDI